MIAEVETDKANVEIATYETGVLTKIIAQVGDTVPVGGVIAQIGGGGVSAAINAARQTPAQPKSALAPTDAAPSTPSPAPHKEPAPMKPPPAAPAAERVKASPLARRMASELGIDLARLTGSGPGGRIVERDISAARAADGASQVAPVAILAAPATGTEIEPSRMRAAIAKRVTQSKQTVPHFYVTMVVEMDRTISLLKELNADVTDGKITVNDIIVKACAVALGKVPEVNATWTTEGRIRRYAEANIGVAVGIDDGLIIPVIRDCHTKTLRQISAEAKSLIGRARANQLRPEEYSGGTFSISNLGMMGVDEFIAIINPPEAAILAIGGISGVPVPLPDSDTLVIRSRMKVTISADHRLLDGVVAARFLQEVKKALEAPFGLVS
jgi:pyruvate dehydrogenase E2 component (dihydrolipoamide acetyltransferase)